MFKTYSDHISEIEKVIDTLNRDYVIPDEFFPANYFVGFSGGNASNGEDFSIELVMLK